MLAIFSFDKRVCEGNVPCLLYKCDEKQSPTPDLHLNPESHYQRQVVFLECLTRSYECIDTYWGAVINRVRSHYSQYNCFILPEKVTQWLLHHYPRRNWCESLALTVHLRAVQQDISTENVVKSRVDCSLGLLNSPDISSKQRTSTWNALMVFQK